jgi:hypothetical protein
MNGDGKKRNVTPLDLINPKMQRVDSDLREKRLSICSSCPSFISATKQCMNCGCIMPLKTKLKDATCPLGKW